MKTKEKVTTLESRIRDGLKVYTEKDIEVTQFVKDGRTQVTSSEKEAKRLTAKRGYYYELFELSDNKHVLVGYGIPQ